MLAMVFVVIHILCVLWLVAGIVGRDVCYWHAARAADLPALRTLIGLAGVFESLSVRPATLVVFVTGLLTASMRGHPVLGAIASGGPYWALTSVVVFLTIVPVIAFVFLPKGRLYRVALAEAEARGEVTPALRRSIADPVVGVARGYELLMIGVLTYLMTTQPF